MNGEFASYPSLEGKAVLVTGGGSGIGASIVEHFVWQGARVAFLDMDAAASSELIERLAPKAIGAPMFVACDLTRIDALKQAIDEVQQKLGGIEILVNNAGRDDRHKWQEVTPEYWDANLATNLRHYFFAIQAVAPGMMERRWGAIINLSSISWMIPSTGLPAYIAAKAAIVGLTRTMAHELGEFGIRVNSVLPGAILTERQRQLWWTPEYEEKIHAGQSIKRTLTPEDVARLVLFLGADDSSAITNQSYVVDGGWV